MYNLFDNSLQSEINQKKYISIPLEQMSLSYSSIISLIKNFVQLLIDYPEIIYKTIKCSTEQDLSDSFILFVTNNLFIDILSQDIIPDKLLAIIEELLFDEINKISDKNDLISVLTNYKILKFFFGLKNYAEMQIYFKLLLGDIIENYENSGMNVIPLIFKVNKLNEYMKNREEKINLELKSQKDFKREEAIRKKANELNTLNNIYKMKFKPDDSTSSSLSGIFGWDEDEELNNEMINSDTFMEKYAPDLNKNELNEKIEKFSDNEDVQYYLKKQLALLENNERLFNNDVFFKHIQELKDSEKLLYYYQRNFNIVRFIILNIYQNYKKTANSIPYSIKCISRIIYNLIKLKFPDIKEIELNKYIKIFFYNIIFEQFVLSSNYSTLMTSTILSEETKYNFKVIFEIWKHFIYGNFYTNDKEEYCDYTPFNWFFIDLIEENIGFSEKIIDVKISDYLLRTNNNYNKSILKNTEIFENKNKLYFYSSCFTIHDLLTIIKIINDNMEYFFEDKNNKTFNDKFKKCFNNIKINEEILNNLKEKEYINKINYFIYYEIFNKYDDILCERKKEDNLSLDGNYNNNNDNENTIIEKQKDINSMKKIKYYLIILLINTDITIVKKNKNINLNKLDQILEELNKYLKIKSNLLGGGEDDIIEDTNITINDTEINLNSLITLLDKIPLKYSNNNFELLFDSLNDEISSNIKKYNFEVLSPFLVDLKTIIINKNLYLINKEKYKNFFIHSKLREFIDNEQIEVKILFKFNENEKYFSIYKIDKEKEKEKIKKSKSTDINKKNKITCHTIPDFLRKFPNFSKLQMLREIELLDLKRIFNIRDRLLDYFHIVKEHLTMKFTENEVKIFYPKIKKRIFEKLYNKIFPKEADEEDLTFHYKCLCLSWIEPKHLNQVDIYNDNFINIMTDLFNQMQNEKSYSGKLEVIEKIFNNISNVLKINKGEKYSTDDIAPICEYALIKAKPERLCSNLKYIQIMMPDMSSNLNKMHYDYLKNYMITIKNCNYKHFYGIKEEEYNRNCKESKNKAYIMNS